MVTFNELRITEDKSRIIVDVEIDEADGFDGFYIDQVKLEYYEQFVSDSYASENAVTLYQFDDDDEDAEPIRHFRICFSLDDYDPTKVTVPDSFGTKTFDNGMFFVFVRCEGSPTNTAVYTGYGCEEVAQTAIGVILDWKRVYEHGISFAARLANRCGNSCDTSNGFESFILLWYALQLAIATCDYIQAKKLWNRFIRAFSSGTTTSFSLSSGCGCGR